MIHLFKKLSSKIYSTVITPNKAIDLSKFVINIYIMPETLYSKINRILEGRQLSISGITRELKTEGFTEHRLVLTGYLRALRDMGMLNETEIPPSKVYTRIDSVEEKSKDIYSMICSNLRDLELDFRLPVGVYIISSLFHRPVFRKELTLIGLNLNNIKKYLESANSIVLESTDKNLKKYRSEITRIDIPQADPAYEIAENNEKIVKMANNVLIDMLKDEIDISGLTPKTKQTKLSI